jgi:class 3 adenylate cyclase
MNPLEPSCLLIADISGYTSYLAGVELDHAQDILADLMGTVVTALRPTFRLAKLEGDAAFTAAPLDKVDGSIVMDTIERCYFGFRRRRRDVRQATSCECDACLRIPDLNLKFVVHTGPVARQRMAGLEELVGRDVIVVHRLLKNTVVESAGIEAYVLFSEAATDSLHLGPEALGMRRHVESYEHIGEVPGWVHDLERRWQEEDARARVLVEAGPAALADVAMPTAAPPQVAWEFMTQPGRRVAWSHGVTDVIVEAPGNRRGVGTTNHCMHGKDAIVEEVLDWRPFDYYTVRSVMGTHAGPVKFLTTFEFEPTVEGTTVHMRIGAGKSARDRAILIDVLPMFGPIFAANAETLRDLVAEDVRSRADAAPPEPPIPAPKADGLFSEMASFPGAG